MKSKHLKIIRKLSRLFLTTQAHRNGGELICEQDIMLNGKQLRRPDIAYFSCEQIDNEEEIVPEFCIEIISTHDKMINVKKKASEYLSYGVRVVWLILIEVREVMVCDFVEDHIYKGEQVFSAFPVLDDFKISVNDLLK